MTKVNRIDRGGLAKPTILPNGFLRVDGYLTRAGVFEYRDPSGNVRREYRPDSEVFATESLESYALAPVTDDHPPDMLTALNAREFMRGSVGAATRTPDGRVRGSLLVTDAELIAKMQAGKVEISCGYECELEETPGEFDGVRYDAIQRAISINHVAVVDRGRAGPDVRVRMDNSSVMVAEVETTKADPMLKKIKFDGVEYEMTEQAAQLLENAQSRLDAKTKECSTLAARCDGMVEKLDASEKARKDAEDPARVAALVSERTRVETGARAILGAEFKMDGKSNGEIMRAALAKANPKLNLDGKDETYVSGRFDGYVEDADKPAFLKKKIAAEEGDDEEEDEDKVREDSVPRTDAESARQAMIAHNAALYEGNK
jgi:hypothetical protein